MAAIIGPSVLPKPSNHSGRTDPFLPRQEGQSWGVNASLGHLLLVRSWDVVRETS